MIPSYSRLPTESRDTMWEEITHFIPLASLTRMLNGNADSEMC